MTSHPGRARVLVRAACVALQASLLAPPAGAGTIRTEYDLLGLPSTITDASGQVTRIQRDLLGRPTLITYADGKSSTLVYDVGAYAKGYLSSFTDRSGTTAYGRNIFGRVTSKTQTLASGFTQQVSYGYNPRSGMLDSITYPDGSTLGHVFDSTGRLIQLNWNGSPLVTGITWNPMGQPTAWNWAFVQGLSARRTYDTAARLTATEFSSYVWDAAGRISSVTQNLLQPGDADPSHSSIASAAVTWSVGYDAVGRITAFDATNSQSSFRYDPNGNRTASTKTLDGRGISRNYMIAAGSNRLLGFSQTSGGTTTNIPYRFNANGDLTSDGLRTFSYDVEGRLSAVTTGATDASPTTRYAHNVLGQRVFKTEPLYPPSEGDETDPGFFQGLIAFFAKLWGPGASEAEKQGYAFIHDEQGNLLAETGTGGANSTGSTQYIYLPTANGPMPIAAVIDGKLYAIHSDHLNTPRRMTDANGQPVWQWAYSAFGDEQPTIAKYRFANLDVSPNPGTTSFAEVVLNKRYDGQYYDRESGLHYNYFRSYDPKTGIYSQNDPMGLTAGLSRRTYVGGNPLNNSDSKGLFLPALAIPILGGTSIGLMDIGVGLGLGAAGYGLDRMFNDAVPPRGLPPEGILPPIPEADQCKPGPASRPSERDKGGQSLWDPKGGEWRWFPGDRWHNPHWDHNAHDGKMSPWINVPHGGLPPVKR